MKKTFNLLNRYKDIIVLYPIFIFPLAVYFTTMHYVNYQINILSLLDFSQILMFSLPYFLFLLMFFTIFNLLSSYIKLCKKLNVISLAISAHVVLALLFVIFYFLFGLSKSSCYLALSSCVFSILTNLTLLFPKIFTLTTQLLLKPFIFFIFLLFLIFFPATFNYDEKPEYQCNVNYENQTERALFLFEGKSFVVLYNYDKKEPILIKKDLIKTIVCTKN